jgi:hypothetical protein
MLRMKSSMIYVEVLGDISFFIKSISVCTLINTASPAGEFAEGLTAEQPDSYWCIQYLTVRATVEALIRLSSI